MMNRDDPRLSKVRSNDGKAERDLLIRIADERDWIMELKGKEGDQPGTAIPHIQFRQYRGQRPYPFSLNLNTRVPTFYVRRPSDPQALLNAFPGAHLNTRREVKIPVPDAATAARIAERFLRKIRVS